jgi:hypothetical protein
MAVKREQTTTCCGKRSRISARRSWVAICSAEAMARGEGIRERVGGATTLHTTTRFSCSSISRANRCRCKEARHSFSLPTASSQRSSRRGAQRMAGMWRSAAEPTSRSNISPPASSTNWRFTSFRFSSVVARLFDNVNYRNVQLPQREAGADPDDCRGGCVSLNGAFLKRKTYEEE